MMKNRTIAMAAGVIVFGLLASASRPRGRGDAVDFEIGPETHNGYIMWQNGEITTLRGQTFQKGGTWYKGRLKTFP